MKTNNGLFSNALNEKVKKSGMLLLLIGGFTSMGAFGQGERNGQQRTRSQGNFGSRPGIERPPTLRQQSPGINTRQNPGSINMNNSNRREVNPVQKKIYERGSHTTTVTNNRTYNGRVYTAPATEREKLVNRNRPGNDYRRQGNNNYQPGYYEKQQANTYQQGNQKLNNNNRGLYNNNFYRQPVYSAYNPNWRYAYAPRRYTIFNTLPSNYLHINFGGNGYRYYDGIYYRPYNNIYRVVAPPRGIFINSLPLGYRRISVNNYPYYYYNGTYYDQQNNNYTVVSPPVGAVVESIPDGYQTIVIDGETYYLVDGAQYKPCLQDNGEIWYEVIKSN